MLLKQATLDGIRAGSITVVFRRWKKPTVKTGGTLRTAIGVLDINTVERIPMRSITADDAVRAGHQSRAALLADLRGREGDVYRIEVAVGGDDPLIELRESADLDAAETRMLVTKLERLDARSARGPWTHAYLELIEASPAVRAAELAAEVGDDRDVFKANVRKLKSLGLTISLSPGYRLSPRGVALLGALR